MKSVQQIPTEPQRNVSLGKDPGVDTFSFERYEGSDLQQKMLQAIGHASCLQDAARSLAFIAGPELEALQIWFCQRGQSSGQVMLDSLLELDLGDLLETGVPELPITIDRLVEKTLNGGTVESVSLKNDLQLTSVPVFFVNQRPAAFVVLCFNADDSRREPPGSPKKRGSSSSPSQLRQRIIVSGLQLISNHLTLWHSQRSKVQGDFSLAGVLSSNLREIINSTSRIQACSLLCTRSAGHLGASHVALFGVHSMGRIRLAGFSGTTQVDRSSHVFQSLENVCLHLHSHPSDSEVVSNVDEGVSGKLLKQVSQSLNQPFSMGSGLYRNNKLEGMAIFVGDESFRRSTEDSSFATDLEAIKDQMICALQWHRSPLHRITKQAIATLKRYRWWAVAAASSVAALGLVPQPYRMNCDCQLATTHKRYIVAPFDGQLSEVMVQPGQVVEAESVLAKMDGGDLRLELIAKEAEFDREIQKSQAARAVGKLADARIAELESQRIKQQIQLLQQRLENQEIRSPIMGTVVQGELRELQGAPVEIGQNLFEIAPLDQLVVEIALPEYQYRYVEEGQQVSISLDAYPFDHWTGTVKRLSPQAEPRDGQNVFIAEVEVENSQALLRPGMKGHATIRGDYYPIAWNWLHYPYEKARSMMRWF